MCRLAWPAEACSLVRTTYLPDAGAFFSLIYVSAALGRAPAEHDHAVQAAQVLVHCKASLLPHRYLQLLALSNLPHG